MERDKVFGRKGMMMKWFAAATLNKYLFQGVDGLLWSMCEITDLPLVGM